jgi:Protein of unknown function (DUF2934)
MAKAKDRPATPRKTSRATTTRKPTNPVPGAPGPETASPAAGSGEPLTPEQLYRMIQETAYFKAKARNFAPGHEVQDWIEAEAEVRRRLENRA